VEIFATCPQSKNVVPDRYARHVADVSRWSEDAGYEGILVYTDNGIVDPWLVAQLIIQSTERLCPLVAVQPAYMHPYAVAKMVTSLAYTHGRRVWLNMVAGGFRNDLLALGDETDHDRRYDRLVEYTQIVFALLRGDGPVTLDGRYYQVKNLTLRPPLPPELMPGLTVSGSSEAGMAAAYALGATPVKYPKPPGEEQARSNGANFGIRVGIVARDNAEEAWDAALERFPEDRDGQITHRLAMQVSDSAWHRQLSRDNRDPGEIGNRNVYWLGPFQNYKTFCPYLVGDYDRVAREIAHYRSLGSTTFILDIPHSAEELEHIATAFRRAEGLSAN
jgi:alkanesulfonate monooxygenase